MKSNHNVLIVGAGRIGTIRAKVAKKLSPKSKLYIFDTDLNKARILAKEVNGIVINSLKDGLKNKDITIVVIAIVNKNAKRICITALKNNKNVFCEKPMGINFKEAKEIAKAVEKYRRKFKCGFNHRYHPAIMQAYKLCKKNEIGKILYLRAVYGHGGRAGYDKEWRAKKQLSGGGELLDQGSHLIDLCHWFFDFEEITKTYCIARTMFWNMDVDDNAFALIETKTGKVAQIQATWTQWKNLFRFEIYGTHGAIEINGLGKSYGTETLRLFKRKFLGKPPEIIEKRFTGYDKSWELEWLDFLKAINSKSLKAQSMSNHKESLEVMKTISNLYSNNIFR